LGPKEKGRGNPAFLFGGIPTDLFQGVSMTADLMAAIGQKRKFGFK